MENAYLMFPKSKTAMNRFFSLLFTAAVGLTAPTTATAQTVTVPYNPDGDANGLIGVTQGEGHLKPRSFFTVS